MVSRLSDADLLINNPLIKNIMIANRELDVATPTLNRAMLFHTGRTELEADGIAKEMVISHDVSNTIIPTT